MANQGVHKLAAAWASCIARSSLVCRFYHGAEDEQNPVSDDRPPLSARVKQVKKKNPLQWKSNYSKYQRYQR